MTMIKKGLFAFFLLTLVSFESQASGLLRRRFLQWMGVSGAGLATPALPKLPETLPQVLPAAPASASAVIDPALRQMQRMYWKNLLTHLPVNPFTSTIYSVTDVLMYLRRTHSPQVDPMAGEIDEFMRTLPKTWDQTDFGDRLHKFNDLRKDKLPHIPEYSLVDLTSKMREFALSQIPQIYRELADEFHVPLQDIQQAVLLMMQPSEIIPMAAQNEFLTRPPVLNDHFVQKFIRKMVPFSMGLATELNTYLNNTALQTSEYALRSALHLNDFSYLSTEFSLRPFGLHATAVRSDYWNPEQFDLQANASALLKSYEKLQVITASLKAFQNYTYIQHVLEMADECSLRLQKQIADLPRILRELKKEHITLVRQNMVEPVKPELLADIPLPTPTEWISTLSHLANTSGLAQSVLEAILENLVKEETAQEVACTEVIPETLALPPPGMDLTFDEIKEDSKEEVPRE